MGWGLVRIRLGEIRVRIGRGGNTTITLTLVTASPDSAETSTISSSSGSGVGPLVSSDMLSETGVTSRPSSANEMGRYVGGTVGIDESE